MLLWKSEFLPDFPPFHLKRKPSTFIPHVLLIEASENIESALNFLFFFKLYFRFCQRVHTDCYFQRRIINWFQGLILDSEHGGNLSQFYSQSCPVNPPSLPWRIPLHPLGVVEKIFQTSVSKAPPCGHMKNNSSEEKKNSWDNCRIRTEFKGQNFRSQNALIYKKIPHYISIILFTCVMFKISKNRLCEPFCTVMASANETDA